jgi:hypothetical protein
VFEVFHQYLQDQRCRTLRLANVQMFHNSAAMYLQAHMFRTTQLYTVHTYLHAHIFRTLQLCIFKLAYPDLCSYVSTSSHVWNYATMYLQARIFRTLQICIYKLTCSELCSYVFTISHIWNYVPMCLQTHIFRTLQLSIYKLT